FAEGRAVRQNNIISPDNKTPAGLWLIDSLTLLADNIQKTIPNKRTHLLDKRHFKTSGKVKS
ncbi:hypothetical protein, partial [Salmonella enterica]|uniref:hypothetical protein n=1 Tax=Salmonella enterica TaxID=28901 RepID=UPI001C4E2DF4